MDDQLYAMYDLERAINRTPDYTLTRVLGNTEIDESWALFRLGTSRQYENFLPAFDGNGELGDMYMFLASREVGNYNSKWCLKYHEVRMHRREMDAAAWALDLAGCWTDLAQAGAETEPE